MESRKALARAVGRLRKQRGWTQAETAAHVGVSQQFFAALEYGEKTPSLETIEALACAFGVRTSELFALGEEKDAARTSFAKELTRIAGSVPKEREAEVLELLRGVVRLAVPKPTPRRRPTPAKATKRRQTTK